ncbi:MAG TPA: FtsW/RodA/SpoVE family cell cycle protein [Paludibacter sp.]|nr:FtsW/RodA/SpoVE family cell cycle protein [Paludibacter sp.]
MESFLKRYMKGDSILWVVFIFMCLVSIIEMYSASSTLAYRAANYSTPVLRHVLFLLTGVALVFGVQFLKLYQIRIFSYVGLIISVILLIFVMFKGQSANDATRWLSIGGFQFQPSEIAKLSLIIVAADLISRIKNKKTDEWKYFGNIIVLLVVVCPLILLENFSTAFLLFFVVFVMMFIGNISVVKLGLVAVTIVVLGFMAFGAVKTIPKESMPKMFDRAYTWVGRIERHFDESENKTAKYEITDDNLQVQHGRIAIARGGFFGLFPGNSVERDFLPQAYSDFIYAIIVEETGMFGGIFVILLFLILLFRAGRIATKSSTVFPAILVIGLSLMLVIQAFVNMAVATSLIPVTGQPLPMISRGGTSIIVTCIYFGVILAITRQLKEEQQNAPKNAEKIPVVSLDEL